MSSKLHYSRQVHVMGHPDKFSSEDCHTHWHATAASTTGGPCCHICNCNWVCASDFRLQVIYRVTSDYHQHSVFITSTDNPKPKQDKTLLLLQKKKQIDE